MCLRYKILDTLIPQQIVRLRHEDNLCIGAIANIVKKSKSVIHGILKVHNGTGPCETGKSTGRPRKPSEEMIVPLQQYDYERKSE